MMRSLSLRLHGIIRQLHDLHIIQPTQPFGLHTKQPFLSVLAYCVPDKVVTSASNFSEQLRPGIWTGPGLQMLEACRGRKATVLVAQCPQRDAHWQVDDGCQTTRYMNILVEKVSRILLRSYYVSTR